jgi:hypothetical protein
MSSVTHFEQAPLETVLKMVENQIRQEQMMTDAYPQVEKAEKVLIAHSGNHWVFRRGR